MSLTFDDLSENVNELLRNNSVNDLSILPQTVRDNIIKKDAVRKYSRVRPLLVIEEYTATSAAWYDLPAGWEDGFSEIDEIEYPVEKTPKEIIEAKEYRVSLMPAGKKIRFSTIKPSSGDAFWIKYSQRHGFLSSGESDIPYADLDVLSYLSCSLLCTSLATFYASKTNPSLSEAEVIGYATRSDEYRNRAEDWMKKYKDELQEDSTGLYGSLDYVRDTYFERKDE